MVMLVSISLIDLCFNHYICLVELFAIRQLASRNFLVVFVLGKNYRFIDFADYVWSSF